MEFINQINVEGVQGFMTLGAFVWGLLIVALVIVDVVSRMPTTSHYQLPVWDSWYHKSEEEVLALGPATERVLLSIVTNEAGGLGRGWRGNTGRGFRAFARGESQAQISSLEVVDKATYSGEPAPQDTVEWVSPLDHGAFRSRTGLIVGRYEFLRAEMNARSLDELWGAVFLATHMEVGIIFDADLPTFTEV